ncbi:MAG: hypothetical protein HC802_22550 [Caldilineaceae bacterium]|nr:hypothetical protein [Caldilineaceae bacterium]
MRLGMLFRVLGTLLYGFIGYYLGIALAGTADLTTESARIIWPATFIGATLGYIFTPWLIIAPARAMRNSMRNVPITDLVAGSVGLAVGLLIAALLAYPIAQLPAPFGSILPFVGVLILATWVRRSSSSDKKISLRSSASTRRSRNRRRSRCRRRICSCWIQASSSTDGSPM